jgi:hypothetical protein
MTSLQSYKAMCRDIVHDQGDPENFSANAVRLTDAQLAIALRHYDDVLPEAAGEILETVTACLSGSRLTHLFGNTPAEAIGVAIIAACRGRVMRTVKNDLECTASDIVLEALEDAEFERGVSA